MSKSALLTSNDLEPLLTHKPIAQDIDIEHYEKNLRDKGDLVLPLAEEVKILRELTEFPLGRFLLQNKGLNGYWTAYIIIHGPKKKDLHPLEAWILNAAPSVKATRERFKIFQQELQKYLKSNMTLASIPCGLMDDLLGLKYENYENIKLVGIDLDEESLKLAQNNAQNYGFDTVNFFKKNAWVLESQEAYDLITSNGLNIYEPNDDKVLALYQEFYKALRPDGIFITSFLTPPPGLSAQSPWRDYDPKDGLKQKALFNDILQVNFQAFRTEEQMCLHLSNAGFQVLDVQYDAQAIFPTIIAKKK